LRWIVSILGNAAFRRNGHVAAEAALIGRATLDGVAIAGQEGAEKALEILRGEVDKNMAYLGCRYIRELGRDIFASPKFAPQREAAKGDLP
jgi:hypothetical protein